MTIYDISQKAGVSIATVSRVLNGSDKVKPSTKKKIMDIIASELNIKKEEITKDGKGSQIIFNRKS